MIKRILVFFVLLFFYNLSYAQIEECGTDFHNKGIDFNESLILSNPQLRSAKTKLSQEFLSNNTSIKIPIVVHVFKDDGRKALMANLTEEKIKEWLDYTNQVFRGELNSKSTPMNIEFVLATMDENCNPTSGIVWVDAHAKLPNYSQYGVSNNGKKEFPNAYTTDELKALSYWNPNKYLNIYVVNDANGPLGFASYPGAAEPINVIVVNYIRVGASTGPHELGHSLGLIHTFEGDEKGTMCPQNTDCLTQGDKVCDTNPHIGFGNCPSATSLSCDNVAFSAMAFDIRNNVMSYSNCSKDLFTPGQRQRAVEQYSLSKLTVINSKGSEPYGANVTVSKPSTSGCITTSNNMSSAYGAGLSFLRLGNIFNPSKGIGESHSDFTRGALVDYTGDNVKCIEQGDFTVQLNRNEEHEITLGVNHNKHSVKVYIDYNNDGVFDENTEKVVSARQNPGQVTYSFTPSSSAPLYKPLRLRAVADINGSLDSTNPCSLSNGQAEDYTVVFVDGIIKPSEVRIEIISEGK